MSEIIIDGVKYVPADDEMATCDRLTYCIVRCRDAGVHAGFVVERQGREVKLARSRRLWRWHGKTLSGLAREGTTCATKCKYANEVPLIEVLDACEIIPCSKEGMDSIRNMKEWVNE